MEASATIGRHFRRVLQSKWMVMVSGMYLMASAAAAYDFSIYSQFVKATMNLNQEQLNTIALCLGIGDGVCFLAGVLYDLWKPWGVILVGILLNTGGYIMAWLGLTGRLLSNIRKLRVWHVGLSLAVGANGQTFAETAVMVVVLRNFPSRPGTVMGLVKGFYGLSGAILPQIYYALFWDNPASFLLLSACLPTVVSLLCLPFMRPAVDQSTTDLLTPGSRDATTLRSFQAIAITLSLYLLGTVVVQGNVADLSRPLVAGLTGIMILILTLPFLVVLWAEAYPTVPSVVPQGKSSELEVQPSLAAANCQPAEGYIELPGLSLGANFKSSSVVDDELTVHAEHKECLVENCHVSTGILSTRLIRHIWRWGKPLHRLITAQPGNVRLGEEHSIIQVLLSLDLWIFFCALGCGLGAIMVLLNNMAQAGYAQGYSSTEVNTLVALVNIWNFFGRILAGSLSDILLMQSNSYIPALITYSRPALMGIFVLVLVVGNCMVALGVSGALYVGSMLAGLSLGAQYTLTAVILSELFGLKSVGTTYTVVACAGPLAQYVLSVRVAGALYDREALKQSVSRSAILLCKGPECFRSTFLIMTGVTAFGVLLYMILTLRTLKYYKSRKQQPRV
ncbi:hypothetical protein GOP47_0029516 [Adiantum capillus-veneris]|nr:hypothetical protein GOP47_0029516 [Adiantum capillus-veneris]